ncbi:MAG: histidine phosphatase family protein [bacterium]|nr:histidine phosphatase family protein [bacterium]
MKRNFPSNDNADEKKRRMKSPVLYLARHGETDYNLKRIFQGASDIPLNETGRKQALALRELLTNIPLTRAYVSPLGRARETASTILIGREIPQKVESRLIEINFGDWEGTPEDEVKERWMEEYMDYRCNMANFHPSNGEAAIDAQRRAGEWWEEVLAEFSTSDEHILVVAHQSLNAVLACYVSGLPLELAWQNFKSKPGEVIRIVAGRVAEVTRLMGENC